MSALYDFYDISGAARISTLQKPIGKAEWECELKRRLEIEKTRKELPVYYYRIYRRCVFALPVVNGWQDTLPMQFQNIYPYPWEIWLLWSLRERWDTLLAGAVLYEDSEAVTLLQAELEAAFAWDTYSIGREAYLGTVHFAMCVYRYLKSGIFTSEVCEHFKELSREFLDKEFFPWFEKFAKEDHSDTVNFIHNINVISVFSCLALAEEIEHPRTAEIEEIAQMMFEIFAGSKEREVPITEMTSYDAFTMDVLTEYWEASGKRAEYVNKCRADLEDELHSFIDTAVPGRGDMLAPLGDVEPEMQFHSLVMVRLAQWFASEEAAHAFGMIPAERVHSLALFEAIQSSLETANTKEACDYVRKNAGSVVLRAGKGADALMCAASTVKWYAHHAQFDAGTFAFATKGNYIITDPGYQQYLEGDEREFTIGKYAHNCPLINGQGQTKHNCKILETSDGYVSLDLTECYSNLNEKAAVLREFRLDGDKRILTVTDTFKNLCDALIENSFTICPEFAVTVNEKEVFLTDGTVRAHMTASEPFKAENAVCMPGARGRLQLIHAQRLGCTDEEKIVFTISVD